MSVDLKPCPFCGAEAEIERVGTPRHSTIYNCTYCGCRLETGEEWWDHGKDWNTRAPDPAVAVLEAEVARLRGDLAYERSANGREAERIFVASLLADEIEVLTNSPSSFDVQDGIALTAFQKRLIGLWRVRDSLPAPSEKEAG